jgi:EAL domain-containing protein (putative c-di-GMP-specific phosphodiesterase class I)
VVDDVARALSESGLPPDSLVLEMTESVLMDDNENVLDILRRIKQLGARLAIDDFGTGYSSLSYLHRFPVDMLKIDRSFVERLSHASDNAELARTIVRLGQSLQLVTVAEGVDDSAQFLALRRMGCDVGQGYYFRPADGERGDQPPAPRRPAGSGPQAGHHRLADRGLAEDLVDAAQLAQAGLGLAPDPAADRLHRDAELPGRGLLGEALALEHARQPLGEGAVVGAVAAHRREGAAGAGRAAQDVDLDAVGEDPEADLDLAAVGAGRVQQGGEHGVVDLLAALGGQGGVAQVAQDELADVGDGRRPGRELLGDHEDRVDDDRLAPLHHGGAVGRPILPGVTHALVQGLLPRRRQFVRL